MKSAKLSNEDEIRKLEGRMAAAETEQEKKQLQAEIDQLRNKDENMKAKDNKIRKLEAAAAEAETEQEKKKLQAQIDELKKQKQKEDISTECQNLLDEYNKTYNNIKNQLNNLLSILKTLSWKKIKRKRKKQLKQYKMKRKNMINQ